MALRFADSFDHYTSLAQIYSTAGSGSIAASALRTGIAGHNISGSNHAGSRITLDAQGTWVLGVAYQTTALGGASMVILETFDAGTAQGCVTLNQGDGTLSIRRGGKSGTVVATSTLAIAPNVFYYIEFKHIIADAGGTLEVRVDGAVWATFTGDTQQTGNATANMVAHGHEGGVDTPAGVERYDDFYVLDGTGGSNDDYLGDHRVDAIFPDGVGNHTEFATLVGAASHWEAVDEADPDGDTSYVEENVVDDRDTFTFGAHPLANGTIAGIQVLMRARKDSAGDAKIARLYRRGSDDQGSDVALQTSYAYHREIMETDPIAVGAWTITNINAAEFGVRVR